MPEGRPVRPENPGRTVRTSQNRVIFDRETMKTGQCVCQRRAQGCRKSPFKVVVLAKIMRFPNELQDKDVLVRVVSNFRGTQ